MPVLHNRISNDALKAKMLAESEPRTTISFYKYFHIADPKVTRDALYQLFTALNVFGRVYLAHEGINAQISVPASNVETFRAQLYAFDPALEGLRLNIALDDDGKSFWVLRMKVRDRIVADGIDDPHFDASNVGEYLQAAEVNAMLDDPDALFIDMRNHYEYEVGHFENALEIPADTFREQLPKAVEMMQAHKDKKIVMYCTGGIRCEKASAWMKHNGFNKVWHIEGGIIEYARKAREQGLRCVLLAKILFLTSGWANVYLMRLSRTATSAVRRATAIPTVKMMAAICCLFSVQYVRKNTKVVVVRFAAKKARYRQRNSDAVGQDVKMAIRSLISLVDV